MLSWGFWAPGPQTVAVGSGLLGKCCGRVWGVRVVRGALGASWGVLWGGLGVLCDLSWRAQEKEPTGQDTHCQKKGV